MAQVASPLHRGEAPVVRALLDSLSLPLLLLAPDATLRHANGAGAAMLAAGRLRLQGAYVSTPRPHATARLHQAVAEAARDGEGVLTLDVGAEFPFGLLLKALGQDNVLLLVVAPSDARGQVGLAEQRRLRALYRLTGAEARIAAATAQGAPLHEISALLGITEATARTHLKRAFAKTATRGQAQLVALLRGGPLALR